MHLRKRDRGITRQVNPDFPRQNLQGFLRELLFVLCDLCDKIGLQEFSLKSAGQVDDLAYNPPRGQGS